MLEPPANPADNLCAQNFGLNGVCVLGDLDNQMNVRKMVTGDSIVNLTIQDFQGGNGVFGFGTDKLSVSHVTALRNSIYGIARFASTRSRIAHNVARDASETADDAKPKKKGDGSVE